jgi:hypothetical protein
MAYLDLFLTSAAGGGECSTSRLGRFTPVPIEEETRWAPESVRAIWRGEKSPAGIRTPDRPARFIVTLLTTLRQDATQVKPGFRILIFTVFERSWG